MTRNNITVGRGEEATKEIVVIMASLTVCDPGDVHETIAGLKAEKIKCSVIALAAEVKICQTLCTATEGTHTVILHRQHFVESLLEHCTPPASTAGGHVTRLIRLGFPKLVAEIGPCSCCETPDLHEEGYMCPQCKVRRTWLIAICLLSYCFSAARRAFSPSGHPYDASSSTTRCAFSPSGQPAIISQECVTLSLFIFSFFFLWCLIYIYILLPFFPGHQFNQAKLCDLPTECRTCSLQLVASSDLLRSQHHLNPAPIYKKIAVAALDKSGCDGCGRVLASQAVDEGATAYKYSCPLCTGSFCYDCDCFVHDVLHKCPQCLA